MKRDHKKYVRSYYKQEGRLPSLREIQRHFKYKSKTSIARLAKKWVEEGFLKRSGRSYVTGPNFNTLKIFGTVQAGLPQDVEGTSIGKSIELDGWMIEDEATTFLLEVEGDSMINAQIKEGDYVLVKHKAPYKVDDLVIAEVDGQWTLKTLKKKRGKYYLKAENDKYSDIYPQEELIIHGIVQAVIRKY